MNSSFLVPDHMVIGYMFDFTLTGDKQDIDRFMLSKYSNGRLFVKLLANKSHSFENGVSFKRLTVAAMNVIQISSSDLAFERHQDCTCWLLESGNSLHRCGVSPTGDNIEDFLQYWFVLLNKTLIPMRAISVRVNSMRACECALSDDFLLYIPRVPHLGLISCYSVPDLQLQLELDVQAKAELNPAAFIVTEHRRLPFNVHVTNNLIVVMSDLIRRGPEDFMISIFNKKDKYNLLHELLSSSRLRFAVAVSDYITWIATRDDHAIEPHLEFKKMIINQNGALMSPSSEICLKLRHKGSSFNPILKASKYQRIIFQQNIPIIGEYPPMNSNDATITNAKNIACTLAFPLSLPSQSGHYGPDISCDQLQRLAAELMDDSCCNQVFILNE